MIQLKNFAHEKQYKETAELLHFVRKLSEPLKSYSNISQIVALCEKVTGFQLETKKAILADFDTALSVGTFKHQSDSLLESCHVLELMEFDAKEGTVNYPKSFKS